MSVASWLVCPPSTVSSCLIANRLKQRCRASPMPDNQPIKPRRDCGPKVNPLPATHNDAIDEPIAILHARALSRCTLLVSLSPRTIGQPSTAHNASHAVAHAIFGNRSLIVGGCPDVHWFQIVSNDAIRIIQNSAREMRDSSPPGPAIGKAGTNSMQPV